jgi:protein-tyrosine-phosphatase
MEDGHGDYVLNLCRKSKNKTAALNIKGPYSLNKEDAWKVYKQIKEKVAQLAKSHRNSKVVSV